MSTSVPSVDVSQLAEILRTGAILIDVREPDEFEAAHVPVANLVPLQSVPSVLDQLPTDQPVYVICQAGGRSLKAAAWLVEQGIQAINVSGGTGAWIANGLPTEAGLPSTEQE